MTLRFAAVLLATGLLIGCARGGEAAPPRTSQVGPAPGASVLMAKSYRFEPVELRVPVGASVTWNNDDNFTHDVRLLGGDGWHSQPLKPGESASHTFAQAGDYAYECTFHPQNMRGKVIVAPS